VIGGIVTEEDPELAESVVVPVAEERLRIDKRLVTTGVVTIEKRVRTEPVHLEEVLAHEELEVERVPVDKFVDEAPQPYTDGDTWILPVVEEVLVVERRLKVREEVRITRRVASRNEVQDLERRIEEVAVHRNPVPTTSARGSR
jgi:uncharacterized protein (TIGR02271 family)